MKIVLKDNMGWKDKGWIVLSLDHNSLKGNVDSTVLSFDQDSSKRKEWLNQKKSNNAFLKSEQDFLKRQYGSNCIAFWPKFIISKGSYKYKYSYKHKFLVVL